MNNPSPGQVAYEAYCAATNNLSLITGANLPPWQLTEPRIQKAWEAAAAAVRHAQTHEVLNTALPEVARTIRRPESDGFTQPPGTRNPK